MQNIHSNVIYSKDKNDPFLFSDYNSLINYAPTFINNLKFSNSIDSIDTVSMSCMHLSGND